MKIGYARAALRRSPKSLPIAPVCVRAREVVRLRALPHLAHPFRKCLGPGEPARELARRSRLEKEPVAAGLDHLGELLHAARYRGCVRERLDERPRQLLIGDAGKKEVGGPAHPVLHFLRPDLPEQPHARMAGDDCLAGAGADHLDMRPGEEVEGLGQRRDPRLGIEAPDEEASDRALIPPSSACACGIRPSEPSSAPARRLCAAARPAARRRGSPCARASFPAIAVPGGALPARARRGHAGGRK